VRPQIGIRREAAESSAARTNDDAVGGLASKRPGDAADYPRAVPESIIVLLVLRRGTRPEEILSQVATRLDREQLVPDDTGTVRVRVSGRGPVAWERVRDALDTAASDWREWLHLEPAPPRL
jgi:hypothetical protein